MTIRSLARRPGLTAVVVLTLALGSGANTAIFSVVHAMLLRPLPYGEAERLVRIQSRRGSDELGVSAPDFLDWHKQSRSFEDLALFSSSHHVNISVGGSAEAVRGTFATPSLFSVLNVKPVLGSVFPRGTEAESSTVLLSHGFWRRRFGADPAVLGRPMRIEGTLVKIVGVMPPGFDFPVHSDLWLPWGPLEGGRRDLRRASAVGRLKLGTGLEEASAEMAALAARLAAAYPDTNSGVGIALVPEREIWVGDVRPFLLLLTGAAGFVLIIACANVTSLFLLRAAEMRREVAIRGALGAGRLRLAFQPLGESLFLGLLGGLCGALLAYGGVPLLVRSIPVDLPVWIEIGVDAPVFGLMLALSLLAGALCGLLPAMQASRLDLQGLLKTGGGAVGEARPRAHALLVVAELSLVLPLLVGAGLLVRSFQHLQDSDPGFDPRNVLTLEVGLPSESYPGKQERADLFQRVLQRIALLPQVEAVGANSDPPFAGQLVWDRKSFTVEGQSAEEQAHNPLANSQLVSPDYFRALRIPLVAGRPFTEGDVDGALPVAIVNRRMAERFWPGESPLGRRLKHGEPSSSSAWLTVVGVAADVHHQGLDSEPGFDLYVSCFQNVRGVLRFVVRTRGEPLASASRVREEIHALAPDLGISEFAPLERLIADSVWKPRLWGTIFGLFSGIGLGLAMVGVYAVVDHAVARRTREMGLRMALGSTRAGVGELLFWETAKLTLIGTVLGVTAALALTRVMASLLYGLSPTDPWSFAGACLLLAAMAALATWIPARRAMQAEPLDAMRSE